MATNIQNTNPTGNSSEPVVVEPTPASVTNPTGAKRVAVYDQGSDATNDLSVHRAVSMHDDPSPVETQSKSSIMSWILGAIILIVLAYFVLQFLF